MKKVYKFFIYYVKIPQVLLLYFYFIFSFIRQNNVIIRIHTAQLNLTHNFDISYQATKDHFRFFPVVTSIGYITKGILKCSKSTIFTIITR